MNGWGWKGGWLVLRLDVGMNKFITSINEFLANCSRELINRPINSQPQSLEQWNIT